MLLQQSDPIFNRGVDVMRPAFSLEPQYRAITLTREDWTKATGAPPAIKGLIWFTDGSKMREGTGAGVYGQLVGRWLSFSLGRDATVFEADIHAILACVYEIQSQNRLEKYVSVCSDSQAALKALKAIRTTFLLVHQHEVGLYWVPRHAGVQGNEVTNELARSSSALRLLGPEPGLGISRRDIQKRLGRWLVNQHWAKW